MTSTLTFEAQYRYTPEQVWRALTHSQALATWLMDNDFEPCVGHHFQFRDTSLPGLVTVIDCQVLILEPPTRLVYTWQTHGMSLPSLVTWMLTPIEGGTQLRLHHSGLTATTSLGSPVSRLQSPGAQYQGQQLSPRASAHSLLTEPVVPAQSEPSQGLLSISLTPDWRFRLTKTLPRVLTQPVPV